MHPASMQILFRELVVTNPGTVQFVHGNFAKASHKSARIARVCSYRGGNSACRLLPVISSRT
jgi:hypothetical protein